MQRSINSEYTQTVSPVIMALYPLGALTLITLYANALIISSLSLATILILVGSWVAIISTRRYRQRLNYVEGLERAQEESGADSLGAAEQGVSAEHPLADSAQGALSPHWIDSLGDRGVGLNNTLMLIVVVPTLLASAYQIEAVRLFPSGAQINQGYDLSTWITFVALEIGGPIKLVLEYLGFEQVNEVAELGERFSAPWKLFMAIVQVGLISLVFDVFRRYLDLKSTLDRFASTAILSVDHLTKVEERLHTYLMSDEVEAHQERQLISDYRSAQSDLHTRVDTLARFLTVFSQRRMVNQLSRSIQHPLQSSLSVDLSDEGRGQLLLALLISGSRSGPLSLMARTAQEVALKSLSVDVPVAIRLAALDVLGSYHPLLNPEAPLALSERDRIEALMSAREQLQLGSAHSVSIELSISYERLTLASSFVLASHGDRGAIASLLMLRLSESTILKGEGEQRLYHILGRSSQRAGGALEEIVEIIGASERRDDERVERAIATLMTRLSTSSLGDHRDRLDPHLVQQLISTLISQLSSARTLRSTVEKLSEAELSSLSLVLWATLQPRFQDLELAGGIIEGIQSSATLYEEVGDHLIHALRFGSPHEVRRNQEIGASFSDPDTFILPQRFINELDELAELLSVGESARSLPLSDAEIERQILNLLSGLCRLNIDLYRDRVRAWLDQVPWKRRTPYIETATQLLYAIVGDSERFNMLFQEYLASLSEDEPTPHQRAAYHLIHILDPSALAVEAEWSELLKESLKGRVADARKRAQEVLEGVQESTTSVRFAWLWALLRVDVHHSLRSPLIQRLATRAKHINQSKLAPLTHDRPQDWMRREVIRCCQVETNQSVMSQWLKLLGALGGTFSQSAQLDPRSFLYTVLDGELQLKQAGVRRAAAEAIGHLSDSDGVTSEQLIKRFKSLGAQGAQAGVARALLKLNDAPARAFFARLSSESHILNSDGFCAMTRALHQARDFSSLSQLLLNIERLSDRELGELLKPFSTSGLPPLGLREHLSAEAIQVTRDLVLEKLRSPEVSAQVVASCVGVIPLIVQSDDAEVLEELMRAVSSPDLRQGDCEKITNALSLTFPSAFLSNFEEVLAKLTHNNKPKWMIGLVHHDPSRCVTSLLEIADKYRDLPEQINPNNITAMTAVLLQYGGSRGRRFIYRWLSSYPHIAYAIIRWVKSLGSRELDAPRLKDELYRNQRLLNQLSTSKSNHQRDKEKAAAQLRVELLSALYQFGEDSAFADLVMLATRQASNYLEQVLKHEALSALPREVTALFSSSDLLEEES